MNKEDDPIAPEANLTERVRVLEIKVAELSTKIDMLIKSNENMKMILQYVVLPLLTILAGLLGVNLVVP